MSGSEEKRRRGIKRAWEKLEAVFNLPSTSTRGKLFHQYAQDVLCDSGATFISKLGSLFDELPCSEVVARLNTEILLRNQSHRAGKSSRVGLCAIDVDHAWEAYLKPNCKLEKVKRPNIKELKRLKLKWGDSGILEDGDAKTNMPPRFKDERNDEQGLSSFQLAEPSEVDDEGSAMEDIDMSILEEESSEENDRIVAHAHIVCTILGQCSDVLTLLVGPEKEKFVCHKMLICYYTESVNKYCCENLKAAEQRSIKITEECPTQIRTFIAWLYSGLVDTTFPPVEMEQLWVLGDRFSSPAFANEVMFRLFKKYGSGIRCITAETAQYVYGATDAGSRLRLFVKALISSHGPLSTRSLANNTKEFQEEWFSIIRKGGDIVVDIVVHSSFSNDDPSRSPCNPENQAEYLLPIASTIDDFLEIQDELRAEKIGGSNAEVEMQ